jgi:phage replication-related protein YjqB (UPF0714/DUF867 family)
MNRRPFTGGFVNLYRSFQQLAEKEREGIDFRIQWRWGRTGIAVMAPHGGGIEPGTSEVARAVAEPHHSFYHLDGLKRKGNGRLHITSTLFDEPAALEMARRSWKVITIHGCDGTNPTAYLGGLDEDLRVRVATVLRSRGFSAAPHPVFRGDQKENLCNRGSSGAGLQLELSEALRASFFARLDRPGRDHPTPIFFEFVAALKAALAGLSEP